MILSVISELLVSLPDWANTNHSKAYLLGMGSALMVRIFRFMLRNFKRMGREDFS